MAETKKAFERRMKEGFFDKYVKPPIINIGGVGDTIQGYVDRLHITERTYDIKFGDGDATTMEDIPDESFQTVYASHVLEHLDKPEVALQNWYRILQPGGYLIIDVPSAILYEKQNHLPSRWNADHRTMWYLDFTELDNNISEEIPDNKTYAFGYHVALRDIVETVLPESKVIECRVLNEGYNANGDLHPSGEYSLEIIVQKPVVKPPTKRKTSKGK